MANILQEFNLKKSRGKRLKWLEEFSMGLRAGGGEKTIYCSFC